MFSLFNLQGTLGTFDRFAHRFIGADASAANFDMISQASPSVKNFFQILSGFFCAIRAPSEALAYNIILSQHCQLFFEIFSLFFQLFSRKQNIETRLDPCLNILWHTPSTLRQKRPASLRLTLLML